MKKIKELQRCILLFLVTLPTALSIHCYVCNSTADPIECSHGGFTGNPAFIKHCDAEQHENGEAIKQVCRKIAIWDDTEGTSKWIVTRNCGYVNVESNDTDICQDKRKSFLDQLHLDCTCPHNQCNSGKATYPNEGIISLSIVIVVYKIY